MIQVLNLKRLRLQANKQPDGETEIIILSHFVNGETLK